MPDDPGDKPKRPIRKTTAQARAAQARAAQQARLDAAQRRRNRVLLASGASALVVVLIVVLIIVKASSGNGSKKVVTTDTNPPVSASVLAGLTAITPAQLAQAGKQVGSNVGAPTAITDTPLTDAGKPEVFYLGAEFCPYCAAERWPVVLALLQFGSFTGLTESHSRSSCALLRCFRQTSARRFRNHGRDRA